MKSHIIVGPTAIWVLAALLILPFVDSAIALKIRRLNITALEPKDRLTPAASIGIPRRLPSPWSGKLGAFRGRPRSTTTLPPTTLQTVVEDLFEAASNATEENIDDVSLRKRYGTAPENAVLSENSRSVVWPLRSRPGKRFRINTSTTQEPVLLLKLLQPRPTRPAIYSLDGFVPKPSNRVVVSTEPPQHFRKTDLQQLGSSPRRRKVNRYSKEDEEEDEYQYVGTRKRKKKLVSRYTAFARKGVPGDDYPVFTYIPRTEFDCGPQPGLYADPFTDCQVWHMCPGGNLSPRHSFLCPNGTIFNQKKRICDWWYNVDCRKHTRRIRSYFQDPTDLTEEEEE